MNDFSNSFVDWTVVDLVRSLTRYARGNAVEELERAIFLAMEQTPALTTNLGRTALILGLRALGTPKESGVLIPAIVCATVIQAILRSGHTPIIVDTADDLHIAPETIAPESLAGAGAIVVPHLYGMSAPIIPLARWAAAHKLRLIDDAAQAAGVRLGRKPLGTFGDIGILSFGPQKYIACTRGGVLLSSNIETINAAKTLLHGTESSRDAVRRIVGGMLKRHFRRSILRLKTVIAAQKHQRRGSDAGLQASNPGYPEDAISGLPPLEAATVWTMLPRMETMVAARRKSADDIIRSLQGRPGIETPAPDGTPFAKIPVRLTGELKAAEAVALLRKMNIDASRVYRPLALYPEYAAYARQPVPNSIRLWETTFLIPNPLHCRSRRYMLHLHKAMDRICTGDFQAAHAPQ